MNALATWNIGSNFNFEFHSHSFMYAIRVAPAPFATNSSFGCVRFLCFIQCLLLSTACAGSHIISGFQSNILVYHAYEMQNRNISSISFLLVFFDESPSNRKQIYQNEMQMTQWPISMLFWKSFFSLSTDTIKNTRQASNKSFVQN